MFLRRFLLPATLTSALLLSGVAMACSDLSGFYPGEDPEWETARVGLETLFEECLDSTEYFALYGAALLNTGRLPEAMESLERALLLDPENGAALIDYAAALLQDGQLFAAIEANALVLEREDIPPALEPQVATRQRDWSALTRQTSWQLDLLGGYDDNLNGAPDRDLVALTLAGEPIFLNLSQEFQSVSGPFFNLRGLLRHRQLAPDSQHNFIGQVRTRLSEDTASDVLQVSGRYNRLQATRRNSLQLGGGLNHLMFGGNPLFTGSDARFRYQVGRSLGCRPYYGGALQHQLWHNQSRLNGFEAALSVGSTCPLAGLGGQRLNVEASVLRNAALKDSRLGGDRQGWQFVVDWQVAVARGVFSAQFNHTTLLDERGYTPLLANNARRDIARNSVLLQYREQVNFIGSGAQLMVNVYHQDQNSNLSLFEIEDTSLEIGLSWRF